MNAAPLEFIAMDVNVSVATASETASTECVPNNPQKIENTLRTELSLVNMSPRVTRRQRCALLAAAIENEIKHTVDGSVGVAKLAPFVAPSSETDASRRQHPPLTCPVAPGIENPITENKPNARLESSCAPGQTLSPKPFLGSLADKQDIPVELESGSTDTLASASGDSSIPNHQLTNPALLGKRICIWPDPHPVDPIARATAPARDPTAAVPEVQTAPDAETEAIPAEVPNVFKRHGCRVKVLAAVATSVSLPSDKHSGPTPKVELHDDNTEDLGIFLRNDEEWVDGALPDYPPNSQDSNFTKEHSVNPVVTDPPEPRARSKRKTRRLTTVPEEGGKEPPLKINRQTAISPSRVDPLALRLPSGSDPTPPDSPKDVKTKQISFNETVKCWNPILQELTWRQIVDDVRGEVPLLKPVPKSKKKKSAVRRKKSKNPIELPNDDTEREADPMESGDVVEIDGICVPKSLKAPENLRPALKPAVQEPQVAIADVIGSPVVTKPTDSSPRRKNKKRKSFLKNMTQLTEKYGEDFSYVRCLKVDGRFHCPDEECMDNNHRGYGAERALRNHIRIHHIDVPS